jgi:hypothetical protein
VASNVRRTRPQRTEFSEWYRDPLHSRFPFGVLEFTAPGQKSWRANKDNLLKSFVQAVNCVPADILYQVRVRVHRLRDWRLAQKRLHDLRMLALYEERCDECMA